MIKYVVTKQGKEYRSYNETHYEIVIDNHLSFKDIIEEGIIENGKRFIVSSKGETLPDNLLRARKIESLYLYGYVKQGD